MSEEKTKKFPPGEGDGWFKPEEGEYSECRHLAPHGKMYLFKRYLAGRSTSFDEAVLFLKSKGHDFMLGSDGGFAIAWDMSNDQKVKFSARPRSHSFQQFFAIGQNAEKYVYYGVAPNTGWPTEPTPASHFNITETTTPQSIFGEGDIVLCVSLLQ